jgi:hypothetical protein
VKTGAATPIKTPTQQRHASAGKVITSKLVTHHTSPVLYKNSRNFDSLTQAFFYYQKNKKPQKPAPHAGQQMYYEVSRVLPPSIFPFSSLSLGRDAVNEAFKCISGKFISNWH